MTLNLFGFSWSHACTPAVKHASSAVIELCNFGAYKVNRRLDDRTLGGLLHGRRRFMPATNMEKGGVQPKETNEQWWRRRNEATEESNRQDYIRAIESRIFSRIEAETATVGLTWDEHTPIRQHHLMRTTCSDGPEATLAPQANGCRAAGRIRRSEAMKPSSRQGHGGRPVDCKIPNTDSLQSTSPRNDDGPF